MATILETQFSLIHRFYYTDKFTVPEIAIKLNVSVDAVYYFMRKNQLKRRTFSEEQALRFKKKKPSFIVRSDTEGKLEELKAIGAMLYWGEGYKGNELSRYTYVDFANSDPSMIAIFLAFLRGVYILDEKKFRILLYCYSNQNIKDLMRFWSTLTHIPLTQFSKPYVRQDPRKNVRTMKYGLAHIRYCDKKLLIELKNLIECYKAKYAPVV